MGKIKGRYAAQVIVDIDVDVDPNELLAYQIASIKDLIENSLSETIKSAAIEEVGKEYGTVMVDKQYCDVHIVEGEAE